MPEQCNRCRYWQEDMEDRDPGAADHGYGWCRRRPPTIVDSIAVHMLPPLRYGQQVDSDLGPLLMLDASRFPSTGSRDWCGEYQPNAQVPL